MAEKAAEFKALQAQAETVSYDMMCSFLFLIFIKLVTSEASWLVIKWLVAQNSLNG